MVPRSCDELNCNPSEVRGNHRRASRQTLFQRAAVGRFRAPGNEKGRGHSPVFVLAPRPGLEPGTHRLHESPRFCEGWTISSSTWDVGRCGIYWIGSSSLVSAPSRLLVVWRTTALRRAWLRITATRSAAAFLNSPDFSLLVAE